MPKIKFPAYNPESGDRETPRPGLYPVKVAAAEPHVKEGRNSLHVTFEITGKTHTGAQIHRYMPLDNPSSEWVLAQFANAIGMDLRGKSIDLNKLVGKTLQLQTEVEDSKEFGEQARVRRMIPLDTADEEELDDEEESDEDEAGDEEEVPDYNDWPLGDLRKELKKRELETVGKKAELVARLEQDDEGEDIFDDEDEEEPEEETVDYSELSLKELKALARDRGVKTKGKDADDLIEELEELDEEEGDEDEDE